MTDTPVLLMSGCGLGKECWRDLEALLGDRVVRSYDRPGLGGTHWPGHLPTLDEEASRVIALLGDLGGRAVLVAHSMAAFHAEAVARLRPDLVAAVVLVDPSVEWLAGPPGTPTPRVATWVQRVARLEPLGRLGGLVWRLGTWLQSNRPARSHVDADSLAAGTAESIAYPRQAWHLVNLRRAHPWREIPVVVLSAGEGWGASSYATQQTRLARLLGGQQRVVEGSKHMMMLDRPDAIAAAVRGLE